FYFSSPVSHRAPPSFPTRRSSDLNRGELTLACLRSLFEQRRAGIELHAYVVDDASSDGTPDAIKSEFPFVDLISGNGQLFWNGRSEEHTSELQSRENLVCRLLLEK